jgi:hypothetical protein
VEAGVKAGVEAGVEAGVKASLILVVTSRRNNVSVGFTMTIVLIVILR